MVSGDPGWLLSSPQEQAPPSKCPPAYIPISAMEGSARGAQDPPQISAGRAGALRPWEERPGMFPASFPMRVGVASHCGAGVLLGLEVTARAEGSLLYLGLYGTGPTHPGELQNENGRRSCPVQLVGWALEAAFTLPTRSAQCVYRVCPSLLEV